MKFVVQRVKKSSVKVDGKIVGKINQGFCVLIGVHENDTKKEAEKMVKKLIGLRIFEDENGKMNLSIKDVGGEILAISQFTLLANSKKGYRPSFIEAARPEKALPMYTYILELIKKEIKVVEKGIFGEHMEVEIQNSGPVTIILESDKI